MNLRCSYCQTMFALGREAIIVALEQMEAEGLHHYDAHCPKCRRANSLSRDRLEKFYPDWREALKEMQEQAAKAAKEQAAAVEEKAKPVAEKAKAPAKSESAKKPAATAKAPAKGGTTSKPAAGSKTK